MYDDLLFYLLLCTLYFTIIYMYYFYYIYFISSINLFHILL